MEGAAPEGGTRVKIAICDDEPAQLALVEGYVREYCQRAGLPAEMVCCASAVELLFRLDEHPDMEVFLLDIQMTGMNGVELARQIRRRNERAALLFITGVSDYIFDGFNLGAINYLLKPIRRDQLNQCLDRAVAQLRQWEDGLVFQLEKQTYRIAKRQILYVESEGHYLNVVCAGRRLRVKRSMKDMEAELSGENFYRAGRSYILNLDAVERITSKEIEMLGGDRIPVPKGKYREISDRFIAHHFRGRG